MVSSPVDLPVKRLTAFRSIRTMRGHTHAHLVEDEGGHAYVTKFQSNPFGPRVLIAEWIGGHLLRRLGLPAPAMALIEAPAHELKLPAVDSGTVPAGTHFGSEYPGDPYSVTVYDFLPQRFQDLIENHYTFAGAFVFDLWVANADYRQAIFFRNGSASRPFTALFVDNSHLFGGPDWNFTERSAVGKHVSRIPYARIRDWGDLSPWLERIEQAVQDGHMVEEITDSIPDGWLTQADRRDLVRISEQLAHRGRTLRDSVAAYIRSSPEQFPDWDEKRGLLAPLSRGYNVGLSP